MVTCAPAPLLATSATHEGAPPKRWFVGQRTRVKHARCGLALAVVLAFSLRAACAAAGEAGSDANPYNLAPGDRINVSVFGQAELSGDFYVDSGGRIRLPVVGEISVADLSLKDAEQQIAQRLADGFLDHPVVSVRVSEFRPVYVMGDVRTPGAYVFRYGAVVASAIAQAGGYVLDRPDVAMVDYLTADERLRGLERSRRALQVRIARLEAQLTGATDFQVSNPELAGDSTLADITANEKAILKSETSDLEQQLSILRGQQPLLEAQIESIKEQSSAENRQLQLIEAHIQDYDKLTKNGLGNRYTGIELQREEARNKGNISGYAAQMAALRIAIGEINLRIEQAESAYRQRVATELENARTSLQQAEGEMPAAREILTMRHRQVEITTLASSANAGRNIVIVRLRKGESQQTAASETTPLQPGDIIEVGQLPPGAALPEATVQPDNPKKSRLVTNSSAEPGPSSH